MSIDPNVGALKEYLTDITTSHSYNKLRDDFWKALGKLPGQKLSRKIVSKMEAGLKGILSNSSNLFEALQFALLSVRLMGITLLKLVDTLKDIKDIPGPKLLHIRTVKGKGYELAEKDQTKWHAPGLFDKITGEIYKKKFDTSPTSKIPGCFRPYHY